MTRSRAVPIAYSRGASVNDNQPEQREAPDFAAFADDVLSDRARQKLLTYVCAPMAMGLHPKNPEKYPGTANWRSEAMALPRAFLPFDCDGFDSPKTFIEMRAILERFQGFGYTTSSHTLDAPRCRIVLAQSRPTDRDEGIRLGAAVQRAMEAELGAGRIKFDASVYRAEQPIFTPLLLATTFRFNGAPLDVDAVLAAAAAAAPPDDAPAAPRASAAGRADQIATNDPILRELQARGMVKSAKNASQGHYNVVCPCAGEHSSESGETTTIYMLPHFGGVTYGKFDCKHDHCRQRPQEQFLQALGLDPHAIWREQNGRSATATSAVVPYAGGRFITDAEGVWYIGTKEGEDQPPKWICSPLTVAAMTRNAKGAAWGRLLEWRDADERPHQWAMPLELLQGDGADARRELVHQGLLISTARQSRELLSAYLQSSRPAQSARCVNRLGWHGDVYVTPGESIGEAGERVVFQAEQALEPALSQRGTLQQWRDGVARLAAGNSRLVFAISTALAGALLDVSGEPPGGFHLRGPSSSGKTTALQAAASVWGNPRDFTRTWRLTDNGLEGLAALHNDGILILDELSQVDPRAAGEAAYMLANGLGKVRANKSGAARSAQQWRLVFLSAGEESLRDRMATAGKRTNVGQEVRLAEIDSDAGAGMGLFEALNGAESPGALALAVKDAAAVAHGVIGVEWLRAVQRDRAEIAERLPSLIGNFVQCVAPAGADGQVQRVARRFGLVAAAGELASAEVLTGDGYGLTGWAEGAAFDAARRCFLAWLAGFGGAGNREAQGMVSQALRFLEAHGASRFTRLGEDLDGAPVADDQRTINRVGFTAVRADDRAEFYVLQESFKAEIAQGYDAKAFCRALLSAGILVPDSNGQSTQVKRLPGLPRQRVYVMRMPEAPDDSPEPIIKGRP